MQAKNVRQSLKWLSVVLLATGLILRLPALYGAEAPVTIAAPVLDDPKAAGAMQIAVLSGGCFWGVQGVCKCSRATRVARNPRPIMKR
jgi:hypothetical protein